jgi:riboflavin kinase / FMN adenylyltransferase
MKIFRSFDNLKEIPNPVVTTGTFDGVHIGHKTILDRLNELADGVNGESVLVTFHPHPRKVLFPEKCADLQLINSQEEKIQLLEKAGLQNLIIIPFTLEFSKTTSQQFVLDILIGKLNAKIIVVGFNHHFGHNREGDYSYLYKLSQLHDFGVEEIPMQDIEHEAVSSTRIRKALNEGHIQRANAYLDHYYNIIGNLSVHEEMSKLISQKIYEIEIVESEKLIPPEGSYAVSVNHKLFHAMAVIRRNIENHPHVYLLVPNEELILSDFDGYVEICFHKTISHNYNYSDELRYKKQIIADLNIINELIF